MALETIIFDLGRVLVRVDFTQGLFPYLDHSPGKDDQAILKEVFEHPLFRKYSTGAIDTPAMYREMKKLFAMELSFERFSALWCDVFGKMEGMEELVDQLAARYRLGILSDTDPLHWAYVTEAFPFLNRIPNPTLSYVTGILKPDPECYRIAAENAGSAPGMCLFIDDRPVNVEGARKAGMQAIQFISPIQLRKELQARGIV